MSNVAAFFDLDRTLIKVNSGVLWARHELRRGAITAGQFARALFWTGMYHLSLIDMERAYAAAVEHYRGALWSEMKARTHAWFHAEVKSKLRPGAEHAIAHHRQQGHHLVILTNSTCFEAEVAADAWAFDAWLANHFPTDADGRMLGTFEQPLCYGPGKVTHASRWAEEHGVELDASFFYTDSFSDLPMLERVGQPHAVSPDPRLRRAAQKRQWPILHW